MQKTVCEVPNTYQYIDNTVSTYYIEQYRGGRRKDFHNRVPGNHYNNVFSRLDREVALIKPQHNTPKQDQHNTR